MISIRGLLLVTAIAALLIGIYTKQTELSRIETAIEECREQQESATQYRIEKRPSYLRDIKVLQVENQRLRETIANLANNRRDSEREFKPASDGGNPKREIAQ